MMRPIRKQPVTLTAIVPHGNRAPYRLVIALAARYRASEPAPPQSTINTYFIARSFRLEALRDFLLFDRARFDADLKRIQAFYADRGYPDARVTGFDAKLNAKQDSVDITVTISEGQPVKVAAINFVGFDDVIPADRKSVV